MRYLNLCKTESSDHRERLEQTMQRQLRDKTASRELRRLRDKRFESGDQRKFRDWRILGSFVVQ